ncbi:MAG: hypothetical protein HOO86_05625 [Bacteroidales bacterium]|nr:hypothetical protein [Bacteroidales bacterium]
MKTSTNLIIITLITLFILTGCITENKAVLNSFKSGKSTVLVCPVLILTSKTSTYDSITSQRIADYLNQKNYAEADVTTLCPPPNNKWRHNEARMLTESSELFASYVKQQKLPDNTFVLYPEFYKGGPDDIIIAVHYLLINNKGGIAMRGLINSHWPEFKQVKPRTTADCVVVFINGFENKMTK